MGCMRAFATTLCLVAASAAEYGADELVDDKCSSDDCSNVFFARHANPTEIRTSMLEDPSDHVHGITKKPETSAKSWAVKEVQNSEDDVSSESWQKWLTNFGHDSYAYPSWVIRQKKECSCSVRVRRFTRTVTCRNTTGNRVRWQTARSLTWCSAMDYLLTHMPAFDLNFLPGAVSVEGESMLDDNVAFSLMAWNASMLDPKPPIEVVMSDLLPYATYHEARENWRPIFFAKYIALVGNLTTSRAIVEEFERVHFMNWTKFQWPSFHGDSKTNTYVLKPFASGSAPPVIGQFDFTAYGYASCTGWSKFLASALKAVGVPAREVGSPCWNTGNFAGLAIHNDNVSACWGGGRPAGPFGGEYLNNHNWVEYWDNEREDWHFVNVPYDGINETKSWFCHTFNETTGCDCASDAGKAGPDHEIFATTWSLAEEDGQYNGGDVIEARNLQLSNNESVSPLVWSPRLRSPSGKLLKDVGLRLVDRTDFYRCKSESDA